MIKEERNKIIKERVSAAVKNQKTCGCKEKGLIIKKGTQYYICKHNTFASVFPELLQYWIDSRDPNLFTPGSNEKVNFSCKICGRLEFKEISKFTRNLGCLACKGSNPNLVIFERSVASDRQMMELWSPNNKIRPEDVFKGSAELYLWKCKENHEWSARACSISAGDRCKACMSIPFSEVERRCKQIWGDIYLYDEKLYVDVHTPMGVFCRKPDHGVFKIRLHHHESGYGCRKCLAEETDSKGVKALKRFFRLTSIIVETEKWFDDFRAESKKPFRYDLFVEKLNCLIEYDGEYHFKAGTAKRELKLAKRKQYDLLKDQYAIRRGFSLVRIPYWVRMLEMVSVLSMVVNLLQKGHKVYIAILIFPRTSRSKDTFAVIG